MRNEPLRDLERGRRYGDSVDAEALHLLECVRRDFISRYALLFAAKYGNKAAMKLNPNLYIEHPHTNGDFDEYTRRLYMNIEFEADNKKERYDMNICRDLIMVVFPFFMAFAQDDPRLASFAADFKVFLLKEDNPFDFNGDLHDEAIVLRDRINELPNYVPDDILSTNSPIDSSAWMGMLESLKEYIEYGFVLNSYKRFIPFYFLIRKLSHLIHHLTEGYPMYSSAESQLTKVQLWTLSRIKLIASHSLLGYQLPVWDEAFYRSA